MKARWLIVLVAISLILGLVGCQSASNGITPTSTPIPSAKPNVISCAVTFVTSAGATLGGNILAIGGENVIACRGFQWGLSSGDYPERWIENGNYPIGDFSYTLNSLSGDTTYYYRAFATSSAGTGYGAELSVSTLSMPSVIAWNDGSSGDLIRAGPARIDVENMYLGAVADTWVGDRTMENGYQYTRGEPLCFTVYNNTSAVREYAIELDNGDYGQPTDYTNWVSVSTWNPVVPALSAMNIPIRIKIPKAVTEPIPHQWEFRFAVIPMGQGSVQGSVSIRFVITMK